MKRLLGMILLAAIMGTWGCAARGDTLTTDPRLQKIRSDMEQLLKGKPEIFFQGKIHRDIFSGIQILIAGSPESLPTRAGMTICVGGICHSQVVPIRHLRYYNVKVPPVSWRGRRVIPVVIGLFHIKGIQPLTGVAVFEKEPFVERKLLLEYRSTMANEQLESSPALSPMRPAWKFSPDAYRSAPEQP